MYSSANIRSAVLLKPFVCVVHVFTYVAAVNSAYPTFHVQFPALDKHAGIVQQLCVTEAPPAQTLTAGV